MFVIIILLANLSINASAWDDCPFGLVDEKYPGTCPRYIDTNKDGICDHSQLDPTEEIDDYNTGSQIVVQQESGFNNIKFPVMLLISFIIIFGLVVLGKYFRKINRLSVIKEKLIWNILLLIFFLPSAITGVILLLTTNLGILRELGLSLLQVHDITSLFFMWISAYHIIWHTRYYLKVTKKLVKS